MGIGHPYKVVEFDVEEREVENNTKEVDEVMLGICPWVKKKKTTCVVMMTVYVIYSKRTIPIPCFTAVVRTTSFIHYKKI